MATEWRRAPLEGLCSVCGEMYQKGALIFVIRLANVERPRMRCQRCAWEPAPADVPPLVERPPNTVRKPFAMTRFSPGMLPLDFKVRSSGESDE